MDERNEHIEKLQVELHNVNKRLALMERKMREMEVNVRRTARMAEQNKARVR